MPDAEWVNNTICLDTGVVFGGALTALRYPTREIVAVPAEQEWFTPSRPLVAEQVEREPAVLHVDDVIGTRWLESPHAGKVKVPEANAAAALEVMSRFAVDPRWLAYLPPTMSPASTSRLDGFLEHPEQAFADYAAAGVTHVVCEEKHMGSRAIASLARDADLAANRFGAADGRSGVVHTRTGRSFFSDDVVSAVLVERLAAACTPLFESLETDWLILDCELLPWSAKALGLIREQYASVGAAAHAALPAVIDVLARAGARGLDVTALADRTARRTAHAEAFRDVYAAYAVDQPPGADPLAGVTLAPFQVLAAEGRALAVTEPHPWHLAQLSALDDPLITPTRHRTVDLASSTDREAAVQWWTELTAAGGEGMVVKPAHLVGDRVQPGLKVRGREYLRLIYGPDYTDSLDLLRERSLGKKRSLATREHGLGLDALEMLVAGEPLWKRHQVVFAILALESEPVDPRL